MSKLTVFALLAIVTIGVSAWKAPLTKKNSGLAKSDDLSGCHPPTRTCYENMKTFGCHPPTRTCIQKASGCHFRTCMEKASGCRTRVCLKELSGCHFRTCMDKVKPDACHPPTRNCFLKTLNQPMKHSTGQYEYSYTMPISVGTPPQAFNVYLDMTNGDFWVPQPSCITDSGNKCQTKNKFNTTASSTYNTLPYSWNPQRSDNKTLKGALIEDVVILGSGPDAISVPQTYFGLATQIGDGIIDPSLVDGILGLTLDARGSEASAILEHATLQRVFWPEVTTIWLDPKNGGQISFASYDKQHCQTDKIDYFEQWDYSAWTIDAETTVFNDQQMDHLAPDDTVPLVIDINSPDILMDYDSLNTIVTSLDATYNFEESAYTVDCATKFTWGFQLLGNKWTLNQDQLLTNKSKDDQCILPFGLNFNSDFSYVLGEAWLRNFCTHLHTGIMQLGFSALKN